MAGELTAKGMDTKSRIVATASSIIDAAGLAGLTMDRVCHEAHVSKSQLYHYFSSREVLIEAVAESVVGGVLGLQEDLFAELNSLAAFRRWARALVDIQISRDGEGGCPIGSLSSQLDERQISIQEILRGGFHDWQAAIERGLREMQRRGELPDDHDVAREAQLFLIAIQGGLVLTDAFRDPTWLSKALEERLRLLALLVR